MPKKTKVRLDGFACDRSAPGWDDLPDGFRDLVERSLRLQARVALLDKEIYHRKNPQKTEDDPDSANSVKAQISPAPRPLSATTRLPGVVSGIEANKNPAQQSGVLLVCTRSWRTGKRD